MRVLCRLISLGEGGGGILRSVCRDEEVARLEKELADLREALVSRGVIGEAKGILMERFWLTADEAFQLLTRLASEREMKLRDIAAELVRTRELPRGSIGETPRDN